MLHPSSLIPTPPRPLFELKSDHLPVLFALYVGAFPYSYTPRHIPETDWKQIDSQLSRKLDASPPLSSEGDVDEAISHITQNILTSYKNSTTYTPPSPAFNQLPLEILALIRERRRLLRIFRRTRDPLDRLNFNDAARTLSEKLKVHHTKSWEDYLAKSGVDGCSDIWKVQNRLRNPVPTVTALSFPHENPPRVTYDPAVKAEIFADVLEERFTPTPLPVEPSKIKIYTKAPFQIPADFAITESDTRAATKTVKIRKAPGHDRVTGEMLRHLPRTAIRFLTALFNACLVLGYFPAAWKNATVVMLPKPGKNGRDPNNHRPISLLPILGKTLERIVLVRLSRILDSANAIRAEQFGFRKGRCSATQTLRLAMEAMSAIKQGLSLPAVFFDFSFAFDKVHHLLLLTKLKPLVPEFLLQFLGSYLSGRKFRVRYRNFTSTLRSINGGVPQGAVLSPTLFSVYTRDIPSVPMVSEFIYADYIAYAYTEFARRPFTVRHLQRAVDRLVDWSLKNGFTINPAKC